MEAQPEKTILYSILILAIICPLLAMFQDTRLGAVLFPVCLIAAGRSLLLLRQRERDEDPGSRRAAQRKRDQANVIYVELVDQYGDELPTDIAQQRLQAAQLTAGPRDTIVPVRSRKEPSA